MKPFLKILLLTTLLATASCSRPREIPDTKLQQIFADMYLVNAYSNHRGLNTDSLDIYTPVLAKHGYRARDLVYTIEHFSRRKSSRLADVINSSIESLDKEYKVYEIRVALLDTINERASARFGKTLYKADVLSIDRLADTARMRIRIPAEMGRYRIRCSALVDTADKNMSLHIASRLYDSTGRNTEERLEWLFAGIRHRSDIQLTSGPEAKTLEIFFGGYRRSSSAPSLRVDSIEVSFLPLLEAALDSLDNSFVARRYINSRKPWQPAAVK